jgi:TPR repeat protein
LLKRAANAGNAQAALELGMTFDPASLVERGVVGSAPDVAQARAWYERAMELGSTEASRRLEGLVSMGR